MKTYTYEEIQNLPTEELFSYAKEKGHRMTKQIHKDIKISYGGGLKEFFIETSTFLSENEIDLQKTNVGMYLQPNSVLLSFNKELNVNCQEDKMDLLKWFHSMDEWAQRDRQEFERLKEKHGW